jgi:hypothetical protein
VTEDHEERAYHTNVWAQEVRCRIVDALIRHRPSLTPKSIIQEAMELERWVMSGEVTLRP